MHNSLTVDSDFLQLKDTNFKQAQISLTQFSPEHFPFSLSSLPLSVEVGHVGVFLIPDISASCEEVLVHTSTTQDTCGSWMNY